MTTWAASATQVYQAGAATATERLLGLYLSGDVANDTFFRLNADDAGLNEVVHDAALRINLGDKLTIVAHNSSSDGVIFRHICDATYRHTAAHRRHNHRWTTCPLSTRNEYNNNK